MTPSLRIGLVFSTAEASILARENLDLVWIPAGVALSEGDIAKVVGCQAINLNRYLAPGAIVDSSRILAPLIRSMLDSMKPAPIEAVASQNDIYQYHLRMQHYFLASLEAAVKSISMPKLFLAIHPYRKYWSPMRPALGLMHDARRLDAYLAIQLCEKLGVSIKWPKARWGMLGDVRLFAERLLRALILRSYRSLLLAKKTWIASRDLSSRRTCQKSDSISRDNPVGIVVRTDSEVVSASFLCSELSHRGVPFLLIHDELLASQTTKKRLHSMGLTYVSIGSINGVRGLAPLLMSLSGGVKYGKGWKLGLGDTAAASAVVSSRDVWNCMSRRLFDFSLDQKHFALELSDVLSKFNVRSLVTYAYVDQWGAIIQNVGAHHGLKTVAVQNAAQDPEEYPRLAWSDHYCVESIWFKERLVALGYPRGKLTATGLPHFAGDRPGTLPAAGERRSHGKIVVLTQPIYETYFKSIIEQCAEVARRHGMQLLVKYHPRQSPADYADVLTKVRAQVDVAVAQRESLDSVLEGATVAVSVISAALFRAIFVGVPAFSLFPIEERHLDLEYVRHPVMRTVETGVELGEALDDFLTNFDAHYGAYLQSRELYFSEHAAFEPGGDPQVNVADIVLTASAGRNLMSPISGAH